MRAIVMSDVHGNLVALRTVIEHLPAADAIVVAGDICLDGPDPAGCVDLIEELGCTVVMGNTDRDLVTPPVDADEKECAILEWTRERLGNHRLRWLASLPFSHDILDGDRQLASVVHANPRTLDDHLYPWMSDEEFRPYLQDIDAELLAFGHLHVAYTRPVDGVLLVDVASVGQPKDKDQRAAFTVIEWEGDRRTVRQSRVAYDVERAVQRMRESGMPNVEKHVRTLLRASY